MVPPRLEQPLVQLARIWIQCLSSHFPCNAIVHLWLYLGTQYIQLVSPISLLRTQTYIIHNRSLRRVGRRSRKNLLHIDLSSRGIAMSFCKTYRVIRFLWWKMWVMQKSFNKWSSSSYIQKHMSGRKIYETISFSFLLEIEEEETKMFWS